MNNPINTSKTANQVALYLSEVIYKTTEDFQAVTLYAQHEFDYAIPKSKSISESGITFQDFIEWLNKRSGAGDVVEYKNDLYIISSAKQSHVIVSGKLEKGFEDGFISRCNQSLSYEEIKPCDAETHRQFYKTLRRSGLQYSQNTGKVEQFYRPQYGEKVVIYVQQDVWIGIFEEIAETLDEIKIICGYNKTTGEIVYSEPKTIPECLDAIFEPMTQAQTRTLNRNLGKFGKVWNDFAKRIEPLNYQVPKGEMYWYIDETLKIKTAIDKRDRRAADRLRSGNYCRSLEEAMDWVSEIIKSREKILAKPENE